MSIKPIEIVPEMTVPAYFMVGEKDVMSLARKVKVMHDAYGGKLKKFALLKGGHAGIREPPEIEASVKFIDYVWSLNKPMAYNPKIQKLLDQGLGGYGYGYGIDNQKKEEAGCWDCNKDVRKKSKKEKEFRY